MIDKLKQYAGIISSCVAVLGAFFAGALWVFSTFAFASDLRQTNVEVIQMQIDSKSVEIREYNRAIRQARRARDVEEEDDLEIEKQEVVDERVKLEKRQARVAQGQEASNAAVAAPVVDE